MNTTYGHFCTAARSLETVGDRWSLLIVRDLLIAPRRFSDLKRLLTNVTAKLLTIRLRQLEAEGIVKRDQRPGRREVWYELTEKGRDLAPVIHAILLWGVKHERHPLGEDEVAHAEHLIAGMTVALNELAPKPTRNTRWRFEFDDEQSFELAFDGERWSLTDRNGPPDVVVEATARALADFVTRSPEKRRLLTREIELVGRADRVAELVETFRAAPERRK
jgi:DNA-binding HxlR family transcriptional regulator